MRTTVMKGLAAGFFVPFTPAVIASAQDSAAPVAAMSDSVSALSPYGVSDLKLFMQLIFGLAIVLILLILTLWILRYIMRARFSGIAGDAVQILSMRYIEPKKAIALVKVMDRVFIIGIAEQALTTLGELTPEEAGTIRLDREQNRQPFGSILARLRERGSTSG